MTIPELRTERLLLRGPTEADVATWAAFLDADPDFLEFVPTRAALPSTERAERLVRHYLDRWRQSPLAMGWTVTLDDGEFVGFAGVDAASETEGEIEYFIVRPHWRKGYASEVAKCVTDHWFRTTEGTRLVAYVIPENVGSVRAVEKLGYKKTGSVNYLDLMGNPPDVVLRSPIADEYSLTRDEWSGRA